MSSVRVSSVVIQWSARTVFEPQRWRCTTAVTNMAERRCATALLLPVILLSLVATARAHAGHSHGSRHLLAAPPARRPIPGVAFGKQALTALGMRLPAVAKQHGMTIAQLKRVLNQGECAGGGERAGRQLKRMPCCWRVESGRGSTSGRQGDAGGSHRQPRPCFGFCPVRVADAGAPMRGWARTGYVRLPACNSHRAYCAVHEQT
jgi:hypothetical protein